MCHRVRTVSVTPCHFEVKRSKVKVTRSHEARVQREADPKIVGKGDNGDLGRSPNRVQRQNPGVGLGQSLQNMIFLHK